MDIDDIVADDDVEVEAEIGSVEEDGVEAEGSWTVVDAVKVRVIVVESVKVCVVLAVFDMVVVVLVILEIVLVLLVVDTRVERTVIVCVTILLRVRVDAGYFLATNRLNCVSAH